MSPLESFFQQQALWVNVSMGPEHSSPEWQLAQGGPSNETLPQPGCCFKRIIQNQNSAEVEKAIKGRNVKRDCHLKTMFYLYRFLKLLTFPSLGFSYLGDRSGLIRRQARTVTSQCSTATMQIAPGTSSLNRVYSLNTRVQSMIDFLYS